MISSDSIFSSHLIHAQSFKYHQSAVTHLYSSYSDLCSDIQAHNSIFQLGTCTWVSYRQLILIMFKFKLVVFAHHQPSCQNKNKTLLNQHLYLSKWYHHPYIYRSQRSGSHLHTSSSCSYPIQSITESVWLYILYVSQTHSLLPISNSKYSFFFTRLS